MISKRPIPLRRPNRLSPLPVIVLRHRRHRRVHQNRPPLRHWSLARSRVGVLHRNLLKRLIPAACHTRVIHTNRPVVAVRTTLHLRVGTEVHGEATVEHTSLVVAAWDEEGADIAAVAAIAGKIHTTRLVRSVEVLEAAEATAVDQEVTMAVDQATIVADTTMDRLHRITRWVATRAVAVTTKDLLLGSSLTHGNRRTLPR